MNIRRIALFEATGKVGQRLTEEALDRGYKVTAIVRYGTGLKSKHPNLKIIKGDVATKDEISQLAKGHDLVIYAHEPVKEKPSKHVDITRALIDGVKDAGIQHLISIGHTFSYPIENSQEFYDEWKPIVRAQRDALRIFQKEKHIEWCYIHSIEPELEQKTGKYLISNEAFITTLSNERKMPINEYASAIFGEVERRQYEYDYEMGI